MKALEECDCVEKQCKAHSVMDMLWVDVPSVVNLDVMSHRDAHRRASSIRSRSTIRVARTLKPSLNSPAMQYFSCLHGTQTSHMSQHSYAPLSAC